MALFKSMIPHDHTFFVVPLKRLLKNPWELFAIHLMRIWRRTQRRRYGKYAKSLSFQWNVANDEGKNANGAERCQIDICCFAPWRTMLSFFLSVFELFSVDCSTIRFVLSQYHWTIHFLRQLRFVETTFIVEFSHDFCCIFEMTLFLEYKFVSWAWLGMFASIWTSFFRLI